MDGVHIGLDFRSRPTTSHAGRAPRIALVPTVFIRTLITGKQGTEPGRSIEQVSNTGQYL
ncbi:MAG: hypothetical protein ACRDTJ_09855 [Pseudonocardiaceae bacterium]